MKRTREANANFLGEPRTKRAKIHFLELPSDCLLTVFGFSKSSTLLHIIPLVCKTWYELMNNEAMWKSVCMREWPMLELVGSNNCFISSWKQWFKHNAVTVSLLRYTSSVQSLQQQVSALLPDDTSYENSEETGTKLSILQDMNQAIQNMMNIERKKMEYEQRRDELVGKYKNISSVNNADAQKELLFLQMFAKRTISTMDAVEYRSISGKVVRVSVRPGHDAALYAKLGPTFWGPKLYALHPYNLTCSKFIRKLLLVRNSLGLMHANLRDLWKVFHKEIQNAQDPSGLNNNYRKGEEMIDEFEENQELDVTDPDYNIAIIDFTSKAAYEAGKKYLLANPHQFSSAPKEYYKDREFLIDLVKVDYTILSNLSDDQRRDKQWFEALVSHNLKAVRYFSVKLYQHDKRITQHLARELLSECGPDVIYFAPMSLRDDKELMIQVLLTHKDSNLLKYVSSRLKADEDVVSVALRFGSECWSEISPSLYASEKIRKLIMSSCQTLDNACFLCSAPRYRPLFEDKTFAMQIARRVPMRVMDALPAHLKEDIEVIHAAFKSDPNILKLVNVELIENDPIIQADLKHIVTQKPDLMKYACEETVTNKSLMLFLAGFNPSVLKYANEITLDNEFMLELCTNTGCDCIEFVSEEVKGDAQLIYSIIEQAPLSTKWYANSHLETVYKGLSFASEDVLNMDEIFDLLKERIYIMKALARRIQNESILNRWISHEKLLYEVLGPKMKRVNSIVLNMTDQLQPYHVEPDIPMDIDLVLDGLKMNRAKTNWM